MSQRDDALLLQVALEGASVKIRELAAQIIENADHLKQLLKASKGKDKLVYKIVKDKCEKIREQELAAAEQQKKIALLCEQIEAHSRRPFDQLFAATTQSYEQRGDGLKEEAPAQLIAKVAEAFTQCQSTINEQTLLQQEQENREKALANAEDEKNSVLLALKKQLSLLYAVKNVDDVSDDDIETTLQTLAAKWQTLNDIKPIASSQAANYKKLIAAIKFQLSQLVEQGALASQFEKASSLDDADDSSEAESLLKALKKRLSDISLLDGDDLDESVVAAKAFVDTQEKAQKKIQADLQARQRHITALIKKSHQAIASGNSRQAAGIRRTVDEKVSDLKKQNLADLPNFIVSQLENLDSELEKLLDWKNYAVAPKKQQLIEQMEALVSSEENPEAIATKIKRLQDEWKALSKGDSDEALWEQFHQLSQAAYEPCKQYYEELSVIQANNLTKREGLIAQLDDYVSTVLNPASDDGVDESESSNSQVAIDWPAVQNLIAAAKKEWHSYAPVQFTANKKAQKAFDAVVDRIQQQLNKEYEKNRQIKQDLVTKAEALQANDDINTAVNEVKKLQAQWKSVGLTSRKDDQKLWKAFRSSCDAVFEKRQEKSNAFKAELDENKKQALQIISELELLLNEESLSSVTDKFQELKNAFVQLGTLPKAEANKIKQKYTKACDAFEEKQKQQRQLLKEQKWLNIFEAINKVRLYHLAKDEAEKTQLRDDANDFIDSVDAWPKEAKAMIQEQLAAEFSTTAEQQANSEKALRLLCVRTEILADKETPAEDKQLRMEYQVECLKQGLGQAANNAKDELNSLVFEWIKVPPVLDEPYVELVERFITTRRLARS
jgi:hypothetical protein